MVPGCVLKKFCIVTILLITLIVVNNVHAGLIYQEINDAGLTLETVQSINPGTTEILGALHADDGADVYGFKWEGGDFSAGTTGSDFDTMLSIFDKAGSLLAFNDDFFVDNEKISFISIYLPEGDYLLGITYYDNNYNGDIFGYSNIGIDGTYQIELSPAGPQVLIEPAPVALLGIGLLGFVFIRRSSRVKLS